MKALKDLIRMVKSVVKVAKLLSVDDSGAIRRGTVSYMGHSGLPVVVMTPYGLLHNPPTNSLCLLFSQNGQESNAFAVVDDPNNRPLNLEPGEVAIANYLTGDYVRFKADGTIEVKSATSVDVDAPDVTTTGNLAVGGDLTVAGDASVTGDVSAANATVAGTTTTGTIVFTSTGQTINVDGSIVVVNGDVEADDVSLKQHTHDHGVGPGTTDPPNTTP